MSFQAQFEECHMLNPYPELNSRDTFWAQLKEHQQPTFEASLKPCRSRNQTAKAHHFAATRSPSAAHEAPGVAASRSSGRGRVPPGASRLKCSLFCTYHLAESSLSPGVTCAGCHLNHRYRLAGWTPPQGATPVQRVVLVFLHSSPFVILYHAVTFLHNIISLISHFFTIVLNLTQFFNPFIPMIVLLKINPSHQPHNSCISY